MNNKIECPACHDEIDLEEHARLNNCSIEEARKTTNYCNKCGHKFTKHRAEIIIEEEIKECISKIMKRLV